MALSEYSVVEISYTYTCMVCVWHFFVPNSTIGVGDRDNTLTPVFRKIQCGNSYDGCRKVFPQNSSTQLILRVRMEGFLEEVSSDLVLSIQTH